MTEEEKIVTLVLEADDDGGIKDILGPNYQEPLPQPAQGDVYRQDRWADVEIGRRHYCISYLTPVAVYEDSKGVTRTERNWSTSTIRHIIKWLGHIGMSTERARWPEIQSRFPRTMPQEELVKMFKEDSLRVKWTKRQASKLGSLPWQKIQTGLKSDSEDRIDVDPHHEPPPAWDV